MNEIIVIGEIYSMPFYEYECKNCGVFEKMQKFSEAPLETCPHCGGQIRRLMSGSGVVFKGTGFYTTDYTKAKTLARKVNKERQVDNEAILDRDIKSYNQQAKNTSSELTDL